jgi:chemosensory pili system protein ChpA (sensor histidine kinase/response regulator)
MQFSQYQIIIAFIEELQEHLNTLEQGLHQLPVITDQPQAIHKLARAAHSIKGGAAMLKLEGIEKTAHRLESVFWELEHHPVRGDLTLETLLWQAFEGLQTLAMELEGTFGLSVQTTQATLQALEPIFADLTGHLNHLRTAPVDLPLAPSFQLVSERSRFSRPRQPWGGLLKALSRLVCRGLRWLSQSFSK